VLKSAPAEGWNAKDGTVAVIICELHLPLGSTGIIKNVLETNWSCVQNQTEYGGERKPGGGRKAELERDNYQIQFVVDGMENGLGHVGTHLLVNEFRIKWPRVSGSQCSTWNG